MLGGVTAVFEMPNTKPPTTSAEALADKVAARDGRMHCDFAFFVGATRDNVDDLAELERLPGAAGIKVFMGSSTGALLVDDDEDARAHPRRRSRRRAAFHAEDEARLKRAHALAASRATRRATATGATPRPRSPATERLVRLAARAGKRVHVLHVSTAEEMALPRRHKDIATVEVTPQHLTLAAPETTSGSARARR